MLPVKFFQLWRSVEALLRVSSVSDLVQVGGGDPVSESEATDAAASPITMLLVVLMHSSKFIIASRNQTQKASFMNYRPFRKKV